ncbi:MFS transporter [Streptomyces sp. NPDC052415]|uniref:MFS transporter n=1 Tax=Streptomyces sp. NPDC052415 TaxID=3365690 RepID=UPI0037D76587
MLALWGGAQTLSVFGDRLYAMAIMWIAWQESGAGAMGLVAVAESVPYIVLGTVGRRLVAGFAGLRRLAAVDAGRAVLVAVLPLVWQVSGMAGMLACAVVLGVGGALFDPNLGALVPELVDKSDVQAVNGLMDLTGRIARIAGPGAAGVLLGLVPRPSLFFFGGLTFLVSAAALLALASRTCVSAGPDHVQAETGIRPRARVLLREQPDTAVAIGVHGAGIFAHTVALVLPAFLAARLDAGAALLPFTGAAAVDERGPDRRPDRWNGLDAVPPGPRGTEPGGCGPGLIRAGPRPLHGTRERGRLSFGARSRRLAQPVLHDHSAAVRTPSAPRSPTVCGAVDGNSRLYGWECETRASLGSVAACPGDATDPRRTRASRDLAFDVLRFPARTAHCGRSIASPVPSLGSGTCRGSGLSASCRPLRVDGWNHLRCRAQGGKRPRWSWAAELSLARRLLE